MSRVQGSSTLQLKQHTILNQQICPEFTDLVTAEPDWQRYLTIRSESYFVEGDCERLLVHAFEKSITEFVVNIVEDADDFLSNVSMFEYWRGAHISEVYNSFRIDP